MYVIYYGVCFVCGTMVTTVHVHTCVLLSHLCTTVNYCTHLCTTVTPVYYCKLLYTPVYYCTHLCTTVHSTVHSCVYTNLYTVQVSERRCSTLVVSTRVGAAWSPHLPRVNHLAYLSSLTIQFHSYLAYLFSVSVQSPCMIPVLLVEALPEDRCIPQTILQSGQYYSSTELQY